MTHVRALLFTDVVDSTELTRTLGDAKMAELWGRHDRIARDLLVEHGGREIDKSDGFLSLFDDASSACAYARAYHRALVPLGLKARAGLHVGPVILTENSASDIARGAKEAETLASQIGAGPESELGLGLARARLVLDPLAIHQPVDSDRRTASHRT